MKNIFSLFGILSIFLCFSNAKADVTQISELELKNREAAPRSFEQPEDLSPDLPNLDDPNAMSDFIRERLKVVSITKNAETKMMDIVPSEEFFAQQREAKKGFFEKIYDSAIKNVSSRNEEVMEGINNSGFFEEISVQQQNWEEQQEQGSDINVVNVPLPPYGEVTPVPTVEHIPYFFTEIDVLPSGLINFRETISIIANGEKLRYGLTRAIPKYSTSREGKRSKINLTLVSVFINGLEVPYKTKETEEVIFITPAYQNELKPGFYTYEINYAIDRRLWYYDTFDEFYWDVTGSLWTLVVARTGAILRLPSGVEPISHSLAIGDFANLNSDFTQVFSNRKGTSFIAARPLFAGEGMHILASLDKQGLIEPGVSKKLSWFIDDYGNALFAFLGLLAIVISYFMSWREMNTNESNRGLFMKKSAPLTRYLAKDTFDKTSFVAFLLELFEKNIIDIQKSDADILLVKRTDNLKVLTPKEKKAVSELFINRESVLNINSYNMLKIRRAYRTIQKNVVNGFRNFTLKLNLGYLVSSTAMILLTTICMSFINVDKTQTFLVSLIGLVLYAGALLLIWNKKYLFKSVGCGLAVLVLLFLNIFIGILSGLFFFGMVYAVFHYTKLFGKRSGLIKSYISEAHNAQETLIKNKEAIASGRVFVTQQANIFALEIEKEFPKNTSIKDLYRLDLAKEILKKL